MTGMQRRSFFLVLTATAILAGCASPASFTPSQSRELVEQVTAGVSAGDPGAELLQLPESIRQELETRIDRDWSNTRKFRELSEYLFGARERNIQYEATVSKPAAETYILGRGNCLSVSSLFVAAARHLDFDGHFETMEVSPSWARDGNTMIRYEHIVASGDLGYQTYVIDLLKDYREPNSPRTDISDEQALALYYSNLAVGALIAGEVDKGLQQFRQAILLWPGNSNIWSNIGTAYRRAGQHDLAETSYRYALALDRRNYSALSNLTRFYLMEGRDEEAEAYLSTVRRYYRRNPYYYLQLAHTQIDKDDHKAARKNLRRAEELQKDDPDIHSALAESYALLGDLEMSREQLKLAEKARLAREQRRLQDQRHSNPGLLGL